MKFVDLAVADPVAAARKLIEFANQAEVVQDGRIYIELINGPFLKAGGTPDQFRAGIASAVASGWLALHESGTFVSSLPQVQRCSPDSVNLRGDR